MFREETHSELSIRPKTDLIITNKSLSLPDTEKPKSENPATSNYVAHHSLELMYVKKRE